MIRPHAASAPYAVLSPRILIVRRYAKQQRIVPFDLFDIYDAVIAARVYPYRLSPFFHGKA